MPHIALQPGHGRTFAEYFTDGLGFQNVSHLGRCGMGADEIHIFRLNTGIFQTGLNRLADTFHIGKNQVASVVGTGESDNFRQDFGTAGPGPLMFLQNDSAGAFPDHQAVPVLVEWARRFMRCLIVGRGACQ